MIQAAIAVVMMTAGNLHLSSLGYYFWFVGAGPRPLWLLPPPFSPVWAAINAFNMVDGIDGLLGGLSSVSFAATGIILWFDGQYSLAMWCFAMIAAILPYILLNLGALAVVIKFLWVMPAVP
ncbi:Undecaprenyl-phosphate alpha-N-acetylglucosaminyl 1-phosphate transferase [Raoultella planticola]|uniref:Undecaprenyl-phosphate alpha-N-acetylglucosaminyl 1-phosphate transferase n=1 Tax=Raoultella planticola TaxID=575 RepID=A0A485BFV2_RAOPL|nr:Undecaprenyl-phosphate alpha-N-acetylglucosaminyl 1-phosphate transferase [Raoultella planticola]